MFSNDGLYKIPKGVSTRWASPENTKAENGKGGQVDDGRKGAPCFPIEPGESVILAEENNISGTIRRIWITIEPRSSLMLRGLRLDFFWDASIKPAVSVPLGDFFGHGLGRMATFESALFTSPEGRSFNCYVPMPFKTAMKIIVTNECTERIANFFYDIDYTIGDQHEDDVSYFHAFYNRENSTTERKDYAILPEIKGSGRLLGCNIGVTANKVLYSNSWWGEGEVKIYLDGDKELPTLCGTGTEDYIGTGWGQGKYSHLYQGCTLADEEKMQYCFYRYHIADPVYFSSDIRMTIQQIGYLDSKTRKYLHYNDHPIYSTRNKLMDFSKSAVSTNCGTFERHDDFSSCCYFYLDSPSNSLPELEAAEQRMV